MSDHTELARERVRAESAGRGAKFAWFVASCGLGLAAYQLAYWRARGAFDDLVPGLTTDVAVGFAMGFAIGAALLAIFFLPALIARARRHNNAVPILLVNIFLGWTFLGWVVALVWATTNNVKRSSADNPQPDIAR
jgi:hypothetical protein